MSIQFVAVKCPECRADLSIEEGRAFAFCSYCGAKVMMTNENEHIYRTINEAEIRQAETDRIIKLRMLEMDEKSNISRGALIILWVLATAILLVLGIIGFSVDNAGLGMCLLFSMLVGMWGGIGLFDKKKKKRRVIAGQNEVAISESMEDCCEKNYQSVLAMFQGAGFTNVSAVPMNDLTILQTKRNGQVDSVSINGNEDFEEGDIFPRNANILITYHSR